MISGEPRDGIRKQRRTAGHPAESADLAALHCGDRRRFGAMGQGMRAFPDLLDEEEDVVRVSDQIGDIEALAADACGIRLQHQPHCPADIPAMNLGSGAERNRPPCQVIRDKPVPFVGLEIAIDPGQPQAGWQW